MNTIANRPPSPMAALMVALLLAWPLSALAQGDPPKVDINTAGLEELKSLPGIGPALAQRIIDHREKNGPFKRPEDLMNVSGIGEKKYQQLKDRIKVSQGKDNGA